jgi:hypothetical protein
MLIAKPATREDHEQQCHGLQGVSDNVHVDAPLFCAGWRFRSFFSSQWQVEIIRSARDADISFGD